MTMSVLLTGGAGYIGSHAALALLQSGFRVCVIDNLTNGSTEALRRVQEIAGKELHWVEGDVRDGHLLRRLLIQHGIEAVLHFAGLKSVGQSVLDPLTYYDNNIGGTLQLCQAMSEAGVHKLVFSSSATVYGDPATIPVVESCPTSSPENPYGQTKLMAERMLSDLARADARWRIAVLRYFNPAGAHASGLIGEDPREIPNNLLPYVSQVATGRLKAVQIFGNDYPTPDGTGIRDYIHVVDLVEGHVSALKRLKNQSGLDVWNLGAGRGYSVLEVIKAFERVSGKSVDFNYAPRRSGDIAQCWADPSKAWRELGWKAQRGLEEMLGDAWRWQSANPNGYRDDELTI
ncbi:UDP-glucose 4-epimerase [Variovorax boronicumulans]|uniref:UDP-glucose 4-epimerase GalE n=1 Tax=Variovorax boronicumulans TaxID=436515 RepID=UPI00277DC647|nr:UDP-glucose 4-epimerase GalE [Variovorax boronicumulans]MDP9916408.1 UDP-glucose 4-epimerase [Variovorax boronicumulans]